MADDLHRVPPPMWAPGCALVEIAAGDVTAMAFAKDGRRVVLATFDCLKLYDAATAKQISQWAFPAQGPVLWMDELAAGIVLVQHGGIYQRSHAIDGWTHVSELYDAVHPVQCVAVDPLLRWAAFHRGEGLFVRNLETGQTRGVADESSFEARDWRQIIAATDGNTIVGGCELEGGSWGGLWYDGVAVVDPFAAVVLASDGFGERADDLRPVAVSPNAPYAVSVWDGEVNVFSLPAQPGHLQYEDCSVPRVTDAYYPTAMTCAPDGGMVFGYEDGTVSRFWLVFPGQREPVDPNYDPNDGDAQNGDVVFAHDAPVVQICAGPHGVRLLSRCEDGRVCLWLSESEQATVGSSVERVVGGTKGRLLQAVLARPDDDAPRLVCADWLGSQGNLRGEFITLSCELACMPADAPRRAALAKRAAELRAAHGADWLVECVGGEVATVVESCEFERGFIEQVELNSTAYRTYSQHLFASTPLRAVALTGPPGDVSTLPDLRRLRHLTLALCAFDIIDLAHHDLSGLKTLWIRNDAAIFLAPGFGEIAHLELSSLVELRIDGHFDATTLDVFEQSSSPALQRFARLRRS